MATVLTCSEWMVRGETKKSHSASSDPRLKKYAVYSIADETCHVLAQSSLSSLQSHRSCMFTAAEFNVKQTVKAIRFDL